MRESEARRVRLIGCGCKSRFGRDTARGRAGELTVETGEAIRAYRCPFGGDHWHVGHVPTMETVAEVAAAIRFFATGYEGD